MRDSNVFVNHEIAVWQCPECGGVRTLTFPTTYTISRVCEHWKSSDYVVLAVMQPLNSLAKSFDEHELKYHEESEARTMRERALTEERADYRFGFV
jgi:hypothetical protein